MLHLLHVGEKRECTSNNIVALLLGLLAFMAFRLFLVQTEASRHVSTYFFSKESLYKNWFFSSVVSAIVVQKLVLLLRRLRSILSGSYPDPIVHVYESYGRIARMGRFCQRFQEVGAVVNGALVVHQYEMSHSCQ